MSSFTKRKWTFRRRYFKIEKTGRNTTSWNITLTTIDPLMGKTAGRQVLSRKDTLKYLNENKEILKNDPAYKEFWNLLN